MPREIELTRAQVLALRRRANGLDERLAFGAGALRRAAWAGLQDSVPRAASLSIHARVRDVASGTWQDRSLVQLWGPRHHAYVVAARDRAVFTLGRLTDDAASRTRVEQLADRIDACLDGGVRTYQEVGRALGLHPNALRHAAPTGRVLLRWNGASKPVIWTVAPPSMSPRAARLELARRYVHVFGAATEAGFAEWAGIGLAQARTAFGALARSMTAVRTPLGSAWVLDEDLDALGRRDPGVAAPARLVPSGDALLLLWGADRRLLVPEADRARQLWPSRVWPGALLVDGEVAGTWRRAGAVLTISSWGRLSPARRAAVELEAAFLPLPDVTGSPDVRWVR